MVRSAKSIQLVQLVQNKLHVFVARFIEAQAIGTGRAITHAVDGYLSISHNTPCLPPKILYNVCLKLLLGISVVAREIEDNAFEKFGGANKVYYGKFANGKWRQLLLNGFFNV